jgi:hypothetical protein
MSYKTQIVFCHYYKNHNFLSLNWLCEISLWKSVFTYFMCHNFQIQLFGRNVSKLSEYIQYFLPTYVYIHKIINIISTGSRDFYRYGKLYVNFHCPFPAFKINGDHWWHRIYITYYETHFRAWAFLQEALVQSHVVTCLHSGMNNNCGTPNHTLRWV